MNNIDQFLLNPDNRNEIRHSLATLMEHPGWKLLTDLALSKQGNLIKVLVQEVPTGVDTILKEQYSKGEIAGMQWVLQQPTQVVKMLNYEEERENERNSGNAEY